MNHLARGIAPHRARQENIGHRAFDRHTRTLQRLHVHANRLHDFGRVALRCWLQWRPDDARSGLPMYLQDEVSRDRLGSFRRILGHAEHAQNVRPISCIAALFTSTFSLPNFLTCVSTAFLQKASSRMLPLQMVTSAPSRAKQIATARPIPESPPVISALLSLRSPRPSYSCRDGLPFSSQNSSWEKLAAGVSFESRPGPPVWWQNAWSGFTVVLLDGNNGSER
ncbi:hypothetical protein KC366_g78 [Hortaea werneckii]|nr:hypothetical protein KC366_g78 [Hortaea werneckii]